MIDAGSAGPASAARPLTVETLQPARLEFASDGTPFSTTFGDVYHSAHGGPEQARHVFLGGNDLPQRWQNRDRFVILETGFGLGLNFLATWQAWRADENACRRLHFISCEKFPFTAEDLAIAHRAWPEFAELSQELRAQWPPLVSGLHRLHLAGGRLILTLAFGDGSKLLRTLNASVNAFFLDGFSPARNPEMWSPFLCKALARLAAPEATLATWSVAGHVREALAQAEFDVEKRPGFSSKRHMLAGRFRSRRPDRHPAPRQRQAIIIGAGIAGSATAYALAAAGWQVEVLEQAPAPATGASCNLAGMLRPLPSSDDNRLSRLTRAGYLATRALLATLPEARWAACGVLHLARDEEHEAKQAHAMEMLGWPKEVAEFANREKVGELLGWTADIGGWWFPQAGWVQPSSVCRAALDAFPERISTRFDVVAHRLERNNEGWKVFDAEGQLLAAAPTLIMAAGTGASRFTQFAWLPQGSARGQVSHLPEEKTKPLDKVVFRHAYAMPAIDGVRLIGATSQLNDTDTSVRPKDHAENLRQINRSLSDFTADIDPFSLDGRVGFRPMSPDRLPIVGAVPDAAGAGPNTRLHALPRQPGLWCVQGFGARGIVWSALMADLLLSRLEGEPLPLAMDLVDALDPGRFLIGQIRPSENDIEDD